MREAKQYTPGRKCPICGAVDATRLGRFNYALFEDLAIPGEKELIQCNTCKLVYDDTGLTEEDLSRYYAGNSHYEFVNSGKIGNFKFESESRLDRIIKLLKANTTPPHRILDFGCNRGGLLLRCREHGITETAGLEPGEKARESAKKRRP